ncbi:MAG TPA: hypothetical protein VF763_12350 [Candidatus Limnocylindrales bacterium]
MIDATESGASAGTALRLGSWAAFLVALSAAVALAVGVTTPPRSGAFCTADCVTYPYTDVAAFVPGDYLWMYPALLVTGLLAVLTACLAVVVPNGRRALGLGATALAVVAAASLAIDYAVQLAAVQPSLLHGETAGLSLLSMYNPHGVFIAIEDLGYFTMGLAFLAAAAALPRRSGLERAVVALLALGGALLVGLLLVLAPLLGADLGYQYEVLAMAVGWGTLIVAGPLLGVALRREGSRLAEGGPVGDPRVAAATVR